MLLGVYSQSLKAIFLHLFTEKHWKQEKHAKNPEKRISIGLTSTLKLVKIYNMDECKSSLMTGCRYKTLIFLRYGKRVKLLSIVFTDTEKKLKLLHFFLIR